MRCKFPSKIDLKRQKEDDMYGGYIGKILRVDLSNKRLEIQQLDENLAKNYVGGSGIGAKFLYNETTQGAFLLAVYTLIQWMRLYM